MNQYDGIDTLLDFLEKPPAGLTERRLQDAFRRWIDEGDALALHRCHELPATPAPIRRAQRNRLLRQAVKLVEGEAPAVQLHEAIRLFNLRSWPVWYRLDTAPQHATPLQAILFDVFKTGAYMDFDDRQLRNILMG